MARVVAVFDDLLLGSNVLGMLARRATRRSWPARRSATCPPTSWSWISAAPASTASSWSSGCGPPASWAARARSASTRTCITTLKLRAEAAGFDLVVPRSRMAREGAALVERLG